MTEERFEEIISECWDACNEASNEGLGVSATTMDYQYYKDADETEVWNDTVFDFKEAILSYKERDDECFDYEEEYAKMNDLLDEILR